MRSIVLALVVLSLSELDVRAQENWAEKMFKEGTAHDFGPVPRGAQLIHKFKMQNVFTVPLEINVRVGCNCVTATPSLKVVEPKQEGTIDIVMDATRFTKEKIVNIYVQVSQGSQYVSTATLNVRAYGRVDVVLNPGQTNFGLVSAGQATPPQVVDVEYAGNFNWRVEEIDKQNAPLEVKYAEFLR